MRVENGLQVALAGIGLGVMLAGCGSVTTPRAPQIVYAPPPQPPGAAEAPRQAAPVPPAEPAPAAAPSPTAAASQPEPAPAPAVGGAAPEAAAGAAAADPAEAPAPAASTSGSQPAARTYEVRRGDTLSGIAARPDVYGDAGAWRRLYEANRDRLRDPSRIEPGQVLVIP